ncbi:MSCRAMM family protein, partial [Metabacillus fastidiosus]
AAITGTVTDELTGNVIFNALIQIFNTEGKLISSTITDRTGKFTISNLPEGTFTIRGSANNYAVKLETITVTRGGTTVSNLTLRPDPASISGRVTNLQTSEPIASALVQVFIPGGTIPIWSTLTDSDGQYTLSRLPEGNYNIIFTANGFSSQTVNSTVTAGEAKVINISLAPLPLLTTITGTVRDKTTGLLLENVLIQVFDAQGRLIAITLTNRNGHYVISDLPGGTFTVQAKLNNFVTDSQTVTLAEGETKTVNFTLIRKQPLPPEENPDQKLRKLLLTLLLQLSYNNIETKRSDENIIIINSANVQISTADATENIQILSQLLSALLAEIEGL